MKGPHSSYDYVLLVDVVPNRPVEGKAGCLILLNTHKTQYMHSRNDYGRWGKHLKATSSKVPRKYAIPNNIKICNVWGLHYKLTEYTFDKESNTTWERIYTVNPILITAIENYFSKKDGGSNEALSIQGWVNSFGTSGYPCISIEEHNLPGKIEYDRSRMR